MHSRFPRGLRRLLAPLALVLVVAGCAQPSNPVKMTVSRGAVAAAPSDRFEVAEVVGGEETSPIWMSMVSNGAFRAALVDSLRFNDMYDAASPLRIRATLMDLKQPFAGFDMTVTASARYIVQGPDGALLFDETVVTPYTADFSSSLVGVKRLQLANEGAVRANIDALLKRLVAAGLGGGIAAGAPIS